MKNACNPTQLPTNYPYVPDISWLYVKSYIHFFNYEMIIICSFAICYVLTFWPGQKCHSRWCTGRKWHILMAVMRGNRVGGNWLMKWDEVKKIPLYFHRLTHRKRVTSELHDSYFRLMTIKHSISKIEWASNDYIIQLSSTSQWRCQ